MQQRGSLTTSSVTKSVSLPVRDDDGNVYRWETGIEVVGQNVTVNGASPAEIAALSQAIIPASRTAIQTHLEHLAQIKPIGASDTKQATVLSYLVYDLHEHKISEFVIAEICKAYRHDPDNRFFPDSGKFLQAAKRRMATFREALDQALNPKTQKPKFVPPPVPPKPEIPKKPWDGSKREQWDAATLDAFVQEHKNWQRFVLKALLPVYGWDLEGFEEYLAISETNRI